jgi:hypothetical protein|tara:strand:+ start:2250 stop:2411 length:162 start_codon:yes stop_codon:yes gene_type:complete
MKVPIATLRPQVLLGLAILGSITLLAIHKDLEPVATATIGGIIALSMKVMEGD